MGFALFHVSISVLRRSMYSALGEKRSESKSVWLHGDRRGGSERLKGKDLIPSAKVKPCARMKREPCTLFFIAMVFIQVEETPKREEAKSHVARGDRAGARPLENAGWKAVKLIFHNTYYSAWKGLYPRYI